ncbi:MAG: hypothetical protein MSIBF_00145 [Candidatus Altiarchaeales archaeon IMC4]|nr:MAG: hypothetical protein MSIBF_00145 [Candidatus Altiarchaeales archaeon IMC4]
MYIILIGGGVTGETLANHLIGEGNEVVIVESDEERSKYLAENIDALVIHGDGSSTGILNDAGIDHADAIAVLTHEDNTNLTICQIAKKFNVGRIVARANDPAKKDLYIGLGITAAISPITALVSYFKNALTQGSRRSILSIANGAAEIIEMKVANDKINGRKIKDIGLPKDALIAGIYRHGEILIGCGDEILHNEDLLTIITKTSAVKEVISKIDGSGNGGKGN